MLTYETHNCLRREIQQIVTIKLFVELDPLKCHNLLYEQQPYLDSGHELVTCEFGHV